MAAPVAAPTAQQGFRGDAAHTGVYPATTRPGLSGFEWRTLTGGEVISSPTVSGNIVYVGSGDGRLYALDVRTGARRWMYEAGGAIATTPAVSRGRVFFGTRGGTYVAAEAGSGQRIWSFRTGAPLKLPWGHESGDYYVSSPVVVGGTVIFGGADGVVYALDVVTGEVRWRARTGGRIRSSPAVSAGHVVVGSYDGIVYCFSLRTGAERWRFATAGDTLQSEKFGFDRRSIQSSPAIANGVVYIGARDGFLYALDLESGKERWHYDHKVSWVNASAAIADGMIYTASSDAAFVQAVDAQTGIEKWRTNVDAPVWSSPAVSGDHLYVGDFIGRLHAIDRRDGKDLWKFRTASQILSSPAVWGTLVLVGSTDGAVYAVRTGDSTFQRAVFFDSSYVKAARNNEPDKLATYFARRGYTQLDAPALAQWLEARVKDDLPSILVFAMDVLPERVAQTPLERSAFRRYLDGGGKVVWPGMLPALWPRDPATGDRTASLLALDWPAATALLGVNADAAIFDQRGVRATPIGLKWGLPARWRDAWSVDARGVTDVLGRDEWGLAAAWVKNYGGDPGTGFVRVPGGDPFAVYLAAEYRPSPPLPAAPVAR